MFFRHEVNWVRMLSVLLLTCLPTPWLLNANATDGNAPMRPFLDHEFLSNLYVKYPPVIPGKTPTEQALIEKGEYLTKAGDCIACHSNNVDGDPKPFAGGLPIETPYGVFYSPNITPDDEYGIGKWTEAQFIRAVREGIGAKGERLYPVFPYIYYAKLTVDDVKAIYAYMRHIPAIHQPNRKQRFPFNVPGARLALYGWNFLFFKDREPYKDDPAQSKEWNRGAYIVQSLEHCGMCHTPLSIFGAPRNTYFLTGGFIDGYWAPNVTAAALKGLPKQEVVDVFAKSVLLNQAGPVKGPMAEVNHDSLKYLTKEDHMAIVTYLETVVSKERMDVSQPSDAAPTIARGRKIYARACIVCHHDNRMGAPIIGDSADWGNRLRQRGLEKIYHNAIYGYNAMPLRGGCVSCTDNDVISAVDYLFYQSLTRSQRHNFQQEKYKLPPS